ncbi:MAG: toprim domain-containing protein [Thermoproteota archaeon]|jgi:5S rRNA maturation endonuclease (ribonuclease M5)|nr:toprim domain-containing protein [Nitrosopumilaceae archaeon]
MEFSEQEISDVKNFIISLNSKANSAVIVEGKRDADALKGLGFSGKVLEFHKFGGVSKFADLASRYKHLIVLFDSDRKGRYLTGKIMEQLERRTKVDLSFKKELVTITKGKIRCIEQLSCYKQLI